jgi:hypothetical protein
VLVRADVVKRVVGAVMPADCNVAPVDLEPDDLVIPDCVRRQNIAPRQVPLPPNYSVYILFSSVYRVFQSAQAGRGCALEAPEILRSLLERIAIHPAATGDGGAQQVNKAAAGDLRSTQLVLGYIQSIVPPPEADSPNNPLSDDRDRETWPGMTASRTRTRRSNCWAAPISPSRATRHPTVLRSSRRASHSTRIPSFP